MVLSMSFSARLRSSRFSFLAVFPPLLPPSISSERLIEVESFPSPPYQSPNVAAFAVAFALVVALAFGAVTLLVVAALTAVVAVVDFPVAAFVVAVFVVDAVFVLFVTFAPDFDAVYPALVALGVVV